MKLAYGIIFISAGYSPGILAVKRNNFLPQLMPSSSQWRKQFGLEHIPSQPAQQQQQSQTGRSTGQQPSSSTQQLGHSLISSTELFDNSIINSSPENSQFSIESKKEQHANHENTAEVVRKSDASLIWRRTLAGHVSEVEDNKDIEGYFHVTDSITDALNYYFNFKDQQNMSHNNKNSNRRRRRDTDSNLKGEDFIDYGCWCNRVRYLKESGINDMSALDANYKGGKVVDEIDRVCQDWTKCMRCVTITNSRTFEEAQADQTTRNFQQSNCQFDKLTFAFGIKSSGELTCSDPSNHVRSCAYQTCMCNLDLIEKLADLRHAFEATNSRFNKKHNQQCNYQLKGKYANSQTEQKSQEQQIAESGLSVIGFQSSNSDPATRSANSAMESNNDEFLNDYWSFDYDNTKSEDTDYYDSAPVSIHQNNGPRAPSKFDQDNRDRGETQCCGSVPSWRPYKTNNKQCCRRRVASNSGSESLLQYWIVKKDDNACQIEPTHLLT